MSKRPGIELDFETADRICLLSLKEYKKNLQEDLDEWNANPKTKDNPNGKWLHPEDVVYAVQTLLALKLLIEYYGG